MGCYGVASEQPQDRALLLRTDEQESHRITAIAVTRQVVLRTWDSSYMHEQPHEPPAALVRLDK